MYTRYIPQSDGSYRKKAVPDRSGATPKGQSASGQRRPPPQAPACPASAPAPRSAQPGVSGRQPQRKLNQSLPIGSFFRQLLPADFGTEDLFVVLLLLLMAGDNQKEQNYALLTLALYLFL